MKNIAKKLTALVLTAAMLAPVAAHAGKATVNDEGDIMIRVGLASSSNHNEIGQLACAHLQNVDGLGSGFRFGVYDEELNFEKLAYTDEDITAVAMMKTQNLCYGYDSQQGRYTYSANVDSEVRVGCYHLELEDTYSTYKKAKKAAKDYDDSFVAWIDGDYRVRIGSWFTKDEALEAQDDLGEGEVVGTSSYGINVVETGTANILFQFDEGNGARLAVLPDVSDADDVQTWFRGFKYRGGFTYQRIGGGNLTVVNVLELEDYIKGVTPYEMGRDWPLEALMAQATCARTYALTRLGWHEDLGFDVCNSNWCQVYQGTGSDRPNYGPSDISDKAVERSAGQVIWYGKKLAEAYYSSCHGGASESIQNVWGTKLSEYPYLCGVEDPYEEDTDRLNSMSDWTVTYTASKLASRLQNYGYGVGKKIDHLELTYSDLGNVIKLTVHWSNGQTNTFKPDQIRSYFGLNSIRFTVNGESTVPGSQEKDRENEFILNEEKLITFGRDFADEVYVITGSGEVELIASKPYYIDGEKDKHRLIEEESDKDEGSVSKAGTVTVEDSTYVFEGGGWGHQLGMSQFGAYAMAEAGFDFDEILEFYFPGTHVDDYD